MDKENVYYATGRRKTAIARTWLRPGNGTIMVNEKPVDDYFSVAAAKAMVVQPLILTNNLGSYDVMIRVLGGGINGQAGAIRHGITRDSRVKERKKYGQRGARARYQFSKR